MLVPVSVGAIPTFFVLSISGGRAESRKSWRFRYLRRAGSRRRGGRKDEERRRRTAEATDREKRAKARALGGGEGTRGKELVEEEVRGGERAKELMWKRGIEGIERERAEEDEGRKVNWLSDSVAPSRRPRPGPERGLQKLAGTS
jgi:hypothetical protein